MNTDLKYLIDKKRTRAELDNLMGILNISEPNVTYRSLCKYYTLELILEAAPEVQAVKPFEPLIENGKIVEGHGYNHMFWHMEKFTNQQIWLIINRINETPETIEYIKEYAK